MDGLGVASLLILLCDEENALMNLSKEASTILRNVPKTSHQSNGFVEMMHGLIPGLVRCCVSQLGGETGVTQDLKSERLPLTVKCATFVLTSFVVRPDG